MLATHVIEIPGRGRLRVARLGSGPPLVLLHGYPETLQLWCELAPLLAGRFEVIAFDWPGMGASEPWRGGTTPSHQAARLRELLDFWQIDRAWVAGTDMGGQPALAFAAEFPERAAGVVAMNSLVLWDEKTSWEIAVLRRFGWNRVILSRLPGLVLARAEHTFLPSGVRLPPELRREFWECFQRPGVRKFIIRLCAGYQGRLSRLPELYAQIRCPALVLWGERDRHFPPDHARRLHAAIPGSRLEILPGAEHWMAWYRAPEVAERILDWADLAGDRRSSG
jgi:pimeloyl-ACP methyl ester carboxylesterase